MFSRFQDSTNRTDCFVQFEYARVFNVNFRTAQEAPRTDNPYSAKSHKKLEWRESIDNTGNIEVGFILHGPTVWCLNNHYCIKHFLSIPTRNFKAPLGNVGNNVSLSSDYQLSHVIKDIQSLNLNFPAANSTVANMSLAKENFNGIDVDFDTTDPNFEITTYHEGFENVSTNTVTLTRHEVEQMIDLLGTSSSTDKLRKALDELCVFIKNSDKYDSFDWSQNFSNILLCLFEQLKSPEVEESRSIQKICLFFVKKNKIYLQTD